MLAGNRYAPTTTSVHSVRWGKAARVVGRRGTIKLLNDPWLRKHDLETLRLTKQSDANVPSHLRVRSLLALATIDVSEPSCYNFRSQQLCPVSSSNHLKSTQYKGHLDSYVMVAHHNQQTSGIDSGIASARATVSSQIRPLVLGD